MLAGGKVVRIELFPNGAGLCTTVGGFRLLTSFSGYAGAAVWGALIYALSSFSIRFSQVVISLLLSLLVMTIIFWVRDILTLVIMLVLIALFSVKLRYAKTTMLNYGLQFIGISILLNALFSPFYLLDGRHLGDGATLSELTFIPEFIWIIIWSSMALGLLYLVAFKRAN